MTGPNGHDTEDSEDKVTSITDARIRKILRLQAANDTSEPIINLPPAVKGLSFIILAIFGLCFVVPEETFIDIIMTGGFIPARYSGGMALDLAAVTSPVTHLFLHGGFLHAAINVATLMAFGTGLERAIGAKRMLLIYFASGFSGALAHFIFFSHGQEPLIGASGAISGLFGAVLVMMHDAGKTNGGAGYGRLLPFIIIWVGITLFFGFTGIPGSDAPVGWAAHLGGFFGGFFLYRPIVRLSSR